MHIYHFLLGLIIGLPVFTLHSMHTDSHIAGVTQSRHAIGTEPINNVRDLYSAIETNDTSRVYCIMKNTRYDHNCALYPAMLAARHDHTNILHIILQNAESRCDIHDGNLTLNESVKHGKHNTVHALLLYHVDPNYTEEIETPLNWAVTQNDEHVVYLLLTHNANPLQCNALSQTARMRLRTDNSRNIQQYLVAAEQLRSSEQVCLSRTPSLLSQEAYLHIAIGQGRYDIVHNALNEQQISNTTRAKTLLHAIERLPAYNTNTTAWLHMLRKHTTPAVIQEIVNTAIARLSENTISRHAWARICHDYMPYWANHHVRTGKNTACNRFPGQYALYEALCLSQGIWHLKTTLHAAATSNTMTDIDIICTQ